MAFKMSPADKSVTLLHFHGKYDGWYRRTYLKFERYRYLAISQAHVSKSDIESIWRDAIMPAFL